MRFFKHSLLITLLWGLAACSNDTSKPTESVALADNVSNTAVLPILSTAVIPTLSADAYTPKNIAQNTPVQSVVLDSATQSQRKSQTVAIDLGAPPSLALQKMEQNNSKKQKSDAPEIARAYQIGFAREVPIAKSTASLQNWRTLSNGKQLLTLQLQSTDAKAIRIGLLVRKLPKNAVLRVHNGQTADALQIPATHILDLIAKNVAADGDSDNARTYWTPSTNGAVSVLEIELPVGADIGSVELSIPSISHAVKTATQAGLDVVQSKVAGTCNIDAVCTTPLPPAANAVAQMDFQVGGSPYVCSGTLLGDRQATSTPYFLTADHCIDTQTIASTLETFWFWRSSACNATTVNPNWIGRYSGATLLWNRSIISPGTIASYIPSGTDTSFLQLLDTPPTGVMFAGWNTSRQVISNSTNYMGLHHPTGDLLKRSDGSINNYSLALSDGIYSGSSYTNDPLYRINWLAGVTEGGSSGSALFLNGTSANPQVVGQLFGGSSSCSNPTANDFYGRFDLAYAAGLHQWLDTGAVQAYSVSKMGDFNGDGRSDVIWRLQAGIVRIALMNGANVQQLQTMTGAFPATTVIMGTGDFNGDGKSDIVWRNMNTGAVSISLMNGGTVTQWLSVGVSPIALNVKLEGIGDFDGNGRADMLWRNQTTGRSVMSYHNTDGSVASWPVVSEFINPTTTTALKVGDVNGDSKDDIVWRNMTSGNVVISLMNGNVPTWRSVTTSPISPTVKLEAIGDFDGNGAADLLWRNTATGRSVMSYHNADGSIANWPVVSNYINPTSTDAQGTGDFDGNGKDDILWRNLTTGNTVISLMNGNVPTWVSYGW